MTPRLLITTAIEPALALLPASMDSPEARRMLVAICVQESNLEFRQQVLKRGRPWWEWRGPARGWPQFEAGGLKGVLTHRASKVHAEHAMLLLGYESPAAMMPVWLSELHAALKHNDVLALVMARLLLWTLPMALPERESDGLQQYLEAWRPGAWYRGDAEHRRALTQRWTRSWAVAQEALT